VAPLAADGRELRLEEELVAGDALLREGQQRFADEGFVVMDQLVGGVDGREARPDGQLDEPGGRVLLPRGAVQERREVNLIVGLQKRPPASILRH
jgi:hypothetical protein